MVTEIFDDDGNVVGHKLVSDRTKFDQAAKQVVIDELSEHGRIGTAARKAGVTIGTVRNHVKKDANFAEAVAEAVECYKDKLLDHHQDLVFNGTEKVNFDRNGNIVSKEIIYPIRLIELELKKHDAGYREKQEIQHEHRGGVMVAPAEVKDVSDWEARFGKKDDIVDAEVLEDKRED